MRKAANLDIGDLYLKSRTYKKIQNCSFCYKRVRYGFSIIPPRAQFTILQLFQIFGNFEPIHNRTPQYKAINTRTLKLSIWEKDYWEILKKIYHSLILKYFKDPSIIWHKTSVNNAFMLKLNTVPENVYLFS